MTPPTYSPQGGGVILKRILEEKSREVARARRQKPLATLIAACQLAPKVRPFIQSLRNRKPVAVIAEIKRRSPSRGLICRDFRPQWIAARYQSSGAAALSVLTDRKFFGGSSEILRRIRRTTRLPILRKDFIIDEYQVYESRAMGADAILLIAAALTVMKLKQLNDLARRLGMSVLFEIHNGAEWLKIQSLKPRLVGINNRDLKSFDVDLKVFERLAGRIPKFVVLVAESGIHETLDVRRMKKAGARAVLVGEGLMKHPDPGRALKRLLKEGVG